MSSINRVLAPVAIFVYNRLKNTKEVIGALQNSYLAKDTDGFIFSDGAKTVKNEKAVRKVREYLKTLSGFKSVTIVERVENYYIERNIVEGVTEIINKFGKIIVLEDDGVSARNFLTFMNDALDFYENKEQVMHIATFNFFNLLNDNDKTFFLSYSENSGGGWGTWKNRWDKFRWFSSEEEGLRGLTDQQKNKIQMNGVFLCLDALKLKPIPWDVCWYIAIVRNGGLSVNSPWPLIKNNGLFNGVHFSFINRLFEITGKNPFAVELSGREGVVFNDNIVEDVEAARSLKEFYENLNKRRNRKVDKVMHYFIKILVKLRITKLLEWVLRK